MLDHLKEAVGDRAYRYLRRGGLLQIWRQSSPHNWFIKTKAGDMLWHSERGYPYPNLGLFEHVSDSEEKVVQYWGADSGMAPLSLYRLKAS